MGTLTPSWEEDKLEVYTKMLQDVSALWLTNSISRNVFEWRNLEVNSGVQ